jgi:hypothetical protein
MFELTKLTQYLAYASHVINNWYILVLLAGSAQNTIRLIIQIDTE